MQIEQLTLLITANEPRPDDFVSIISSSAGTFLPHGGFFSFTLKHRSEM